jgi:hypothetical protein
MDPQYLDWYFVQLTHELDAGRDRLYVGSQAAMLSDAGVKRRRLRPAISGVAAALREVRSWATRPLRNPISKR